VEGAIVETPTGGILHMHVHDVATGIIGQPGNGRWHRDLNVGITYHRPRSGRRVVGIVGSSYGLVTEVNLRDVPEALAENIDHISAFRRAGGRRDAHHDGSIDVGRHRVRAQTLSNEPQHVLIVENAVV